MSKDRLSQAEADAFVAGVELGNSIHRAVHPPVQLAYTNRTFGEFVKAARDLGIRDSDPLASIEYGISGTGTGYIRSERDDDGALEIREQSRSEVG